MMQLDFEEFAIANGMGHDVIDVFHKKYQDKESLTEQQHNYMLSLFQRYLLVGGMPDAVNEYLDSHNIVKVREIQDSIHSFYADDASNMNGQ